MTARDKMMKHAYLDGHKVITTSDLLEYARAFETQDRVVAFDKIGDLRVSTVFLGLNHQFFEGPPLWFETMVFSPELEGNEPLWRYSTWEEAETGHRAVVAKVKAGEIK